MSTEDNPTNLSQVDVTQPVAGFATAIAWDNSSENSGLLTEVVLRSANASHALAAISEAVKKEIARTEQSIAHALLRSLHQACKPLTTTGCRSDGTLIFRYDNVRHKPDLGFECHKHQVDGKIVAADPPRIEDLVQEVIDHVIS